MDTKEKSTLQFKFENFTGGLRRNTDATQIQDNEYPLLINGRSRHGAIKPIKLPALVPGLPGGNYQSCYAADNLLLVFINGRAYIKDVSSSTSTFYEVGKLQMDPDVDFIYAELIPGSFSNFYRVATGDNVISGINQTIQPVAISTPSIIVQDGINFPWAVEAGYNARQLQRFSLWNKDGNREYVPVGKNMLYHDGILYVVSKDGTSLYRSVTGRPLDFVVAVDSDGNALDQLADGQEEAERVAHKVSYYPITALFKLNVTPSVQGFGTPFMVSTTTGAHKVIPDFERMLFGEPTYKNVDLFPTGIRNQQSITTANGDIHFIDQTGIRSFNAVEQSMVISKDTALSGPVFELIDGVSQTFTCCAYLDDYSFFGINTIYGPGILIFDNLLERFTGIDMFDGIGQIKQFCQTNVDGIKRLFFITSNNQMYEYSGSTTTATCKFYTKECVTGDEEFQHQLLRLKLDVHDILESGTITATPFSDRLREQSLSLTVDKSLDEQPFPQDIPYGDSSQDTTTPITFAPQNCKQASKIGYLIEFNFMADLHGIQITTKPVHSRVGLKQQASFYRRS